MRRPHLSVAGDRRDHADATDGPPADGDATAGTRVGDREQLIAMVERLRTALWGTQRVLDAFISTRLQEDLDGRAGGPTGGDASDRRS